MSACIIGIREVGGCAGSSSFKCFVCGGKDAGFDLPLFVEPKAEGEALASLFNSRVNNCALLDYRLSEPTWIQVKVCACPKHKPNLHTLSKILRETVSVECNCVFDSADSRDWTHVKRIVTADLIALSTKAGD